MPLAGRRLQCGASQQELSPCWMQWVGRSRYAFCTPCMLHGKHAVDARCCCSRAQAVDLACLMLCQQVSVVLRYQCYGTLVTKNSKHLFAQTSVKPGPLPLGHQGPPVPRLHCGNCTAAWHAGSPTLHWWQKGACTSLFVKLWTFLCSSVSPPTPFLP
jgi:hypothetical protein